MHDFIVTKILASSSLTTLATVGAVSEGISQHVDFTKLLAWVVGGIASITVTVMIALDSRMDGKIKSSEKKMLSEIRHIRELLEEKGVIRNHSSPLDTEK